MNEAEIRKYAKLMQELGLTGLEVNAAGEVVRMERQCAAAMPAAAPAPVEAPAAEETGDCIRSPMVGTFYAAPAENAEPFVRPGDRVKRGDTLCIIEAMKLMNEIPAERDGVIEAVCAENGQVVDYGTPLFRIREG